MANNLKLLRWGELFSQSLDTDKSVCVMTEGAIDPQDKADVLEALGAFTVTTVTSSSTVTAGYTAYLVDDDTAGGAVALEITGTLNQPYWIKKIGSTGNVVITATSGTLDGASSVTLTSQYEAVQLAFDGTNFYIL